MAEHFSNIWFSYRAYRYDAHRKDKLFFFEWTKSLEDWDWKNCIVTAVPGEENHKVKIIIRNMDRVTSKYMGKDITIRYMYDFDVNDIPELELGLYREPPPKNTPDKKCGSEKQRWALCFQRDIQYSLDGNHNRDCWIWEWAEGRKKEETTVYKIYQMLKKIKGNPKISNILHIPVPENDDIVPVVYQPALDSWKNFVREIHCHKLGVAEYEITIIMNGEQLRRHKILDGIYRIIRKELYHRLTDIETFRILLTSDVPENFIFSGIYSNGHNIFDDDVHGDRPWFFQKDTPTHKIKYYFSNKNHPIVFINTSNHSMAEHDNNPILWKWEYVGWDPDSPIKFGTKSRQEIEEMYIKKPKK